MAFGTLYGPTETLVQAPGLWMNMMRLATNPKPNLHKPYMLLLLMMKMVITMPLLGYLLVLVLIFSVLQS